MLFTQNQKIYIVDAYHCVAISIPKILFTNAIPPLFASSLFFSRSNKAIHCLSHDLFIRLYKWLGVPRLFAKGKPYEKKFIHQERTSSPSGRLCDYKDREKLVYRLYG